MMQVQEHNVPTLRFPEFSDEWEERNVGKIAPLQRGFDLLTTEVVHGKYPVVYSNGILRHHKKFKVKGPGVVTGRSGTIGKVTFVLEDYWPHNTSLWVTNFFENEPKFIYYFYIRLKLERFNAGSTVPTLNRNDVHSIKVYIPIRDEQQKISSFLSSIDTKIKQLDKKKAFLEEYKRGMMQKLFSQKLRFKDEQGNDFPDWEKKNLRDVAEIVGGGTPETGSSNYWGGSIQWFTPTEIKQKYLFSSRRTITEKGLKKSSAKKLPIGTLLLSTRATVGDVSIAKVECSTNQGFQSLIIKMGNVNEYWYYWVLKSKNKLLRLSSGSTFLEISKSEISKISVFKPHHDEQQKIADFLSAVDQKIELVRVELTQTKTFKKGLLQQMFV